MTMPMLTPIATTTPLLQVQHLNAHYGNSQVLHDISFSIAAGEIVALLGRNGSGRSSTAKAIMGLMATQGTIAWRGQSLEGRKTFERARLGIGYVPESRDIFPALSVHENLMLGQQSKNQSRPKPQSPLQQSPAQLAAPPAFESSFEHIYRTFPHLQARQFTPAGLLSGGEQQMLALCRTLMGQPQLLILDEPTEGLSPHMTEQVAHCLRELKKQGVGVLLIEQKLTMAVQIADRCLVMGRGAVVFEGQVSDLSDLSAPCAIRQEWLEV